MIAILLLSIYLPSQSVLDTPSPAPLASPSPQLPSPPAPTPLITTTPSPVASPKPPTLLQMANSEGFSVKTQLGAMIVTTSESGTTPTPTLSADVEGPIPFGTRSIGRIGARIVLTGQPGQAEIGPDISNYKGVEVDVRVGTVIGVLGDIRTVLLAEYGITTLIKGSDQQRPRDGLSHSLGAGLSFQSRDASAELTILAAFDEATTTCQPPLICTGFHSGFALVAYGQVPILDGKVLLGGDVSIAGQSSPGINRTSVERITMTVDPVQLFKHNPSPSRSHVPTFSGRSHRLNASFIGPVR